MASEAEKYEVLERIGHGSFGIIKKVRRRNDGFILCRKEICYGKMSEKERKQLQAELDILRKLNHPNIVRYYEKEHFKESHDLHLYMEYCGNGDLGIMIKDLKAKHAFADEELVWTIFAQLVSALYRCHYGEDPPSISGTAVGLAKNARPLKSKQDDFMILHRDLKPENVFLGEGNAVKLGDFGLSKAMQSHDFASTYVGTPFYMSPEICAAEKYTLFSDIWALGCVMYELCTKEPPFNGTTHLQLIQKIKLGKTAPLPRNYSRELQEVITACLQVNPNSRPDTATLLNLPRVKMVRKSQEAAMVMRQHIRARDQAVEELALAREHIARLEAERQIAYEEMDKKLHLEWETRAHLEINRRVDLVEKKYEDTLHRRVEEEVARRIASLPSSQASSWTSTSTAEPAPPADPIPRSSTPTALPGEQPQMISLSTVGEDDDDFPSTTDLTSLSLEDSPLEKKKPLKRSSRTPFTRARTIANAEEALPSPMDVQMVDPSPVRNIASLSLSPRRTGPIEGSNLRQPALRGANIFDKAGMRNAQLTLFPTREEDEADDDDDLADTDASPTRTKMNKDPFKMPSRPSSGIARPMLARQQTMPAPMHHRMKSTPNVFGVGSAAKRPSPSPATSMENLRPTSPSRKPLPKPLAVSPARRAPAAPSQPSPTALSARKGKDDLLKGMQKNKLQGRTLVELNMAELQNQPRKDSGSSEGSSSGENAPCKVAAKVLEPRPEFAPLWDPERDEMPSPFLVKSRKMLVGR